MTSGGSRRELKQAAKVLLDQKMSSVEALAADVRQVELVREERAAAERRMTEAQASYLADYDAAVGAGWSAAELRSLGFTPPARRRRKAAPVTDQATSERRPTTSEESLQSY